MYLQERQMELLKLLEAHGSVSVAELSQAFGVSEVTIRTDLKQLAEQNLLIRTHGGAVADKNGYLSMILRQNRQVAEKARIGKAAADWVSDGAAIFLDSSSTALAIAQHILERRNLTVITNGLVVAQELLKAKDIQVVIPGGTLRKDSISIVNSDGLAALEKYHIQTGFFGAHGIDPTAGLTDVSAEEAALKQSIVGMCQRVVAILDATKWGKVGAASFAGVAQLHAVITDTNAPSEQVNAVRALGVDVRMV